MKRDCRVAVAWAALIGSLGSMLGWYWHDFLDCLAKPVHDVPFGPAILWCVIAALFVKAFSRIVFKD